MKLEQLENCNQTTPKVSLGRRQINERIIKGRVSQKLFLDMTHGVEQSVGIVKKLVA